VTQPNTEPTVDLCDCGSGFHELDCAYLDALMRFKLGEGDIIAVSVPVVGLGDGE
jgi:hypothetical protein